VTKKGCKTWLEGESFGLKSRFPFDPADAVGSRFAAKNDCRLILSGDTRQHHSVDRDDALGVLEDSGCIDQIALTKIFRQQVPALREAVEDLSRGETEAGFDKLEAAGLIHGIEDTDQRLEAIASQHPAAVGDGATSLIVAPTHAECRARYQPSARLTRHNSMCRCRQPGLRYICSQILKPHSKKR
jgi:AAA domain